MVSYATIPLLCCTYWKRAHYRTLVDMLQLEWLKYKRLRTMIIANFLSFSMARYVTYNTFSNHIAPKYVELESKKKLEDTNSLNNNHDNERESRLTCDFSSDKYAQMLAL